MPVEKEILVGIKGDTYIEAGYVYAPYIPLDVSNLTMDVFRRNFTFTNKDITYCNYKFKNFNKFNYPLAKIKCELIKK